MNIKLDQFYTKPNTAELCISFLRNNINIEKYDVILEPSAGNGVFVDLMPEEKILALDLEPYHSKIIKQDFFLIVGAIKADVYLFFSVKVFSISFIKVLKSFIPFLILLKAC